MQPVLEGRTPHPFCSVLSPPIARHSGKQLEKSNGNLVHHHGSSPRLYCSISRTAKSVLRKYFVHLRAAIMLLLRQEQRMIGRRTSAAFRQTVDLPKTQGFRPIWRFLTATIVGNNNPPLNRRFI